MEAELVEQFQKLQLNDIDQLNLIDLPDDMLYEIMKRMPDKDIARLGSLNTGLFKIQNIVQAERPCTEIFLQFLDEALMSILNIGPYYTETFAKRKLYPGPIPATVKRDESYTDVNFDPASGVKVSIHSPVTNRTVVRVIKEMTKFKTMYGYPMYLVLTIRSGNGSERPEMAIQVKEKLSSPNEVNLLQLLSNATDTKYLGLEVIDLLRIVWGAFNTDLLINGKPTPLPINNEVRAQLVKFIKVVSIYFGHVGNKNPSVRVSFLERMLERLIPGHKEYNSSDNFYLPIVKRPLFMDALQRSVNKRKKVSRKKNKYRK